MAKDYRHLWRGAVSTMDKAQAIQTLSSILVDKEGRVFVSHLGRKDTELCAEILDNVSRDLQLPLSHHLRLLVRVL